MAMIDSIRGIGAEPILQVPRKILGGRGYRIGEFPE